MTVIELIKACAQKLDSAGVAFGHGTTNAFDEAAWLVLWKLHFPLDDLDSVQDHVVSSGMQRDVDKLIEERIVTRKPAAYLTQEAWLQGIPFYVDERTIVPRSFIAEILVDGSIDYWLGEHTRKVLDLCTGNGSLAILAAATFPDIEVDAADLSADALAVARINIERHGLKDRIQLIESDGMTDTQGPYDLILCNPPYVCSASMDALPLEYQAEPVMALAGGTDGMDFIRKLLVVAPQRMNPKGVLILEIGNEREHFEAAFPLLEAIWLETNAGEDQVLLLTRDALMI